MKRLGRNRKGNPDPRGARRARRPLRFESLEPRALLSRSGLPPGWADRGAGPDPADFEVPGPPAMIQAGNRHSSDVRAEQGESGNGNMSSLSEGEAAGHGKSLSPTPGEARGHEKKSLRIAGETASEGSIPSLNVNVSADEGISPSLNGNDTAGGGSSLWQSVNETADERILPRQHVGQVSGEGILPSLDVSGTDGEGIIPPLNVSGPASQRVPLLNLSETAGEGILPPLSVSEAAAKPALRLMPPEPLLDNFQAVVTGEVFTFVPQPQPEVSLVVVPAGLLSGVVLRYDAGRGDPEAVPIRIHLHPAAAPAFPAGSEAAGVSPQAAPAAESSTLLGDRSSINASLSTPTTAADTGSVKTTPVADRPSTAMAPLGTNAAPVGPAATDAAAWARGSGTTRPNSGIEKEGGLIDIDVPPQAQSASRSGDDSDLLGMDPDPAVNPQGEATESPVVEGGPARVVDRNHVAKDSNPRRDAAEGGMIELIAAANNASTTEGAAIPEPGPDRHQEIRMDRAVGLFQAFEIAGQDTPRLLRVSHLAAARNSLAPDVAFELAAAEPLARLANATSETQGELSLSVRGVAPLAVAALLVAALDRVHRENAAEAELKKILS